MPKNADKLIGKTFITRSIACFFAVLWLAFCNTPAIAHKVMIFAWVEGNTVYTESKVSGGKEIRDATVFVLDGKGNRLLEGKTDNKGRFSFKMPKETDLRVVLKASMGHRAEWKIPAEDFKGVSRESERSIIQKSDTGPQSKVDTFLPSKNREGKVSKSIDAGITREEIEHLVNDALERKLAPIVDLLSESMDKRPTITEIIGGIGYIFGLVGVALYFKNRSNMSK